jgi:hypothetical protein
LIIFRGLGVSPRVAIEEGGQCVFLGSVGGFIVRELGDGVIW